MDKNFHNGQVLKQAIWKRWKKQDHIDKLIFVDGKDEEPRSHREK